MCDACFSQPTTKLATATDPQLISLLTEIRDSLRVQPQQPDADSTAALNIVKSVAKELQEASQALTQGAKRLNSKGDGFGARQLMEAAQRAARAAEELVGG